MKLFTFATIIFGQVIVLLCLIIIKMTVLTAGTTVLLQILPVDPRDPLRGDYATFGYQISSINPYQVQGNVTAGSNIYVTLKPAGKYYTQTKASVTKPTNGDLFIKGVVTSAPQTQSRYSYDDIPIRVTYGIEDYYLPEGTGQGLGARADQFYAEVVIDDNGQAVLKKVYKNGIPIN